MGTQRFLLETQSFSATEGNDPVALTDLHVYDTTLRDGSQRESLSLSVDDKLAVAAHLDALGVGFIEGGWPRQLTGNRGKSELYERRRSCQRIPSPICLS